MNDDEGPPSCEDRRTTEATDPDAPETPCLATNSSGQDNESNSQAKKRRSRPRNEKRRAKDRERLVERINKQKRETANGHSPYSTICSNDKNYPDLPVRLLCPPSGPHHLGLPRNLRPTPTVPELDLLGTDSVRWRLTKRETWNYPVEKQIETSVLQAFLHMQLYPSVAERIDQMVMTRRTWPQDDLTARYLWLVPGSEPIEEDMYSNLGW